MRNVLRLWREAAFVAAVALAAWELTAGFYAGPIRGRLGLVEDGFTIHFDPQHSALGAAAAAVAALLWRSITRRP